MLTRGLLAGRLFWAPDGGTGTGPDNPGAGTSTDDRADGTRTFTQDQVDQIVRKRADRIAGKQASAAVSQALSAVAERFGVDVDELDDVAERFRASADDAQRAKSWETKAKRYETQLSEAQQRINALTSERDADLKWRTVQEQASGLSNDPALLFDHLEARGRLAVADGKVVVMADGTPSDQSVSDLIKETLKAKPHLQAAAPGPGGGGSRPASGGGSSDEEIDLSTPEGRKRAFAAIRARDAG